MEISLKMYKSTYLYLLYKANISIDNINQLLALYKYIGRVFFFYFSLALESGAFL